MALWLQILLCVLGFIIFTYLVIYLLPTKQTTKLPFRSTRKMIISFQRGGNTKFPENSLESFKLAEEMSKKIYKKGLIPMIKTEVKKTHDDHLICYAYKTLEEMTEEYNDEISHSPLLNLKNIKLEEKHEGATGTIPTVQELIEHCPSMWYMFEIKECNETGIEVARRIIDLLRKSKAESKTIMYSKCDKVNDYIKRMESDRLIHAKLLNNRLLNKMPVFLNIIKNSKNNELIIENNKRGPLFHNLAYIANGHSVAILESKNRKFTKSNINAMLRYETTIISSYDPEKVLEVIQKRK